MKRLIPIAALMLLTACGPKKPTPEQLASADFGPPPTNPQQIVMEHMKTSLFDPYSAQYDRWTNVSRGYLVNHVGPIYGYTGCVYINSKNRMGGYVGYKPFFFVIKNNRVAAIEGGHMSGTIGEQDVLNLCRPLY